TADVLLDRDITDLDYPNGLKVTGLSNITIDGNGHSFIRTTPSQEHDSEDLHVNTGITVSNSTNIVVKNFSRLGGFGVGLFDSGTNTTVDHCTFEGNLYDAMSLAGSGPVVQSCTFRETGFAMRISSSNTVLHNNSFLGGLTSLRKLQGTVASITGNTFVHQA